MARKALPSVTPTDNGRYRSRPRDASGRQLSRTFDTLEDANAFVVEVANETRTGVHLDRRRAKVPTSSWCEEWLEMQTAKSRSGYVYVVNRITSELGRVELRRLTAGRVTKFYKGLLERYSYRTADQTLSMLSMILGAAVDEHLVAENVAKKVNRRSARLAGVETEVVIPTPGEVAAIMAATPDRWGAFVALGFGAGLRFGEVRGVTLDRLDLNRSTLAVDRQLVQEEGKGTYFDQTKNGVKRPVDLPTHLRDALARHIEQWPSDDPDGLIFQGPRGGHIYRSTWWSVWDRIRTEAKRPETRFHDLRHYYASSLLSNGASVPAVAEAIGDTAEEVMRTYAHVMPQDRGIVRAASELGVSKVLDAMRGADPTAVVERP